ncbi:MAG TPA: valine--tRNA ligase, partial [Blastocatellia bacterium]
QRLPHKGETITLAEFTPGDPARIDERAEREMATVIEMIARLRNIRSTFNIAPSIKLKARIAPADAATRDLIARMEEHIKRLAPIEELKIVDKLGAGKGSARAVVGATEIAVPLEGLIDFEKERARLEKELNKLINERGGLEKRLSNQDFISRAAADVVETTRARAEELDDQTAKLRAVIEAL